MIWSKRNSTNKNIKFIWKTVGLVIIIIVLMVGVYFGFIAVSIIKQAEVAPLRELIIKSAEGVKKVAPVEARTGDVYFPESKLYLPRPNIVQTITYNYIEGDASNLEVDIQPELSISTEPIWGTTSLYQAKDSKALFNEIPKFLACSRGVKLVYQAIPNNSTSHDLKHTVYLNNGKTLYIYQEKLCPELNNLVDQLTNIRTF